MTVLQLIKNEENKLLSAASVDDYIISNSTYEDALKKIPDVLNTIVALVSNTINGATMALNPYRQLAGKEKLVEDMSDTTKNIFNSDLQYLGQKVQVLLDLSNRHRSKIARYHKMAELQTKRNFIEGLFKKTDSDTKSVAEKLKESTGIDNFTLGLEDLWRQAREDQDFSAINETNGPLFNKALFKFAELFRKALTDANITGEQLGEMLGKLATDTSWQEFVGEYTDNPEALPTLLGTLNFLATIGSIDLADVYKKLRAKVPEGKAIVPSQMWAAINTYAFLENQGAFGKIIDAIKEALPDDAAPYIKELTPLQHVFFIQGVPGTGKTAVVSNLVVSLYKENHADAEVILAAPHQTQVDNLNKSIPGTTKQMRVSEVLDALSKDKPERDPTKTHSQKFYDESKIKLPNDDPLFTKDKKEKVLIIDEATFMSEADLQKLNKAASQYGIKVVLLGDRKQNGFREIATIQNDKGEEKQVYATSGIEDCLVLGPPELVATIRAENVAQFNNMVAIASVADRAYKI